LISIEEEWLNSTKNNFPSSADRIRVPNSPLIPYSEPVIELPYYLQSKRYLNKAINKKRNEKLNKFKGKPSAFSILRKRKFSDMNDNSPKEVNRTYEDN
jgi:hypothetical protein